MYDKLTHMVATKFKVPAEEFRPGVTFTDLGLDSLDLVDLSLAIEQEFGVAISDDELASIGELDLVAEQVANRAVTV